MRNGEADLDSQLEIALSPEEMAALRDRERGETGLVGAATGRRADIETGAWASLCADGRLAAYHSESSYLAPKAESSDWAIYLWQMPAR